MFPAYKEHAGPFHWTPLEIFKLTFPDSPAEAGDLSVISYVLPQTEATKADNRRETEHPSERWARARIFGEQVNVNLRRHLVGSLEKGGIEVVAPMLSPLWERKEGGPLVYASTWSERHIAHACGLGTFGLCDGLITPRGKAMRLGSVVARIDLPVTPRPYARSPANIVCFIARGPAVSASRGARPAPFPKPATTSKSAMIISGGSAVNTSPAITVLKDLPAVCVRPASRANRGYQGFSGIFLVFLSRKQEICHVLGCGEPPP